MTGLAAIVRDPAGRVLLELRPPGKPLSVAVWCIPQSSLENGQTGDGVYDRRFFGAHEIPEETSLDALLAFLRSPSSLDGSFLVSDATDRVFSALFYGYLWPALTTTWPSANANSRLLWTIRNIPFRKFKSAVPLLLTASDPRSIVPALAAELMFALFYLLDDLIDQRTHRYGRETTLGAGGPAESATAIMLGPMMIDEWLESLQASSRVRRTVQAGAQALADEQVLRRGCGVRSLEEYAEHSARRTRFLGDLWEAACGESGYDAEASLVHRIYGACAVAGQIRNDQRDIRATAPDERYKDIRDGVRNSCVLHLLHAADEPEREWLMGRLAVAGTLTTDDEARLERLLSKYRVDDWASAQVRTLTEQILACIDAADVGDAKKVVLSEWVALQFTSGLDSASEPSRTRVGRFVEAVVELTDRL